VSYDPGTSGADASLTVKPSGPAAGQPRSVDFLRPTSAHYYYADVDVNSQYASVGCLTPDGYEQPVESTRYAYTQLNDPSRPYGHALTTAAASGYAQPTRDSNAAAFASEYTPYADVPAFVHAGQVLLDYEVPRDFASASGPGVAQPYSALTAAMNPLQQPQPALTEGITFGQPYSLLTQPNAYAVRASEESYYLAPADGEMTIMDTRV
jgi:hypothetical protein